MSLIKTVFETVAQFLPDKKHYPLLDRDGFLGKPLVPVDAEAKVKGKARFTSEFDIPNLAHAALVFSTIAKGKVSKIDTGPAKQIPGVLEVITWKNMPKLEAPPLVDMSDMAKGMAGSNLPILQDASVYWNGQPVAIVVAETLEQAEHAAALVEVEYEPEPAATSFDLLKADAVVPSDVLGEPAVISIGSVEKGLKQAHARVDQVYLTPAYNHNALEPHATIALWDEDGSLVVFDSTQSAYMTSRSLALIFRLKPDEVRVLAPFVGGGFGGKGSLWTHTPLCAAAARVVKRPVKLSLSREGVYRMVGGRTRAEQRIALGAARDGKLTALIHTGITATASHARYAEQCTFPTRRLYSSPNIFIEQKIVNLDTIANTWMRAPGSRLEHSRLNRRWTNSHMYCASIQLSFAGSMSPIRIRPPAMNSRPAV